MSNIKNKQHYVFQAYLKYWGGSDNRLWCYKKTENHFFSASTNSVLNKRQMYKLQELNNDEQNFFELIMTVFHLSNIEKNEMRQHIAYYLLPYTNKRIVDILKRINPVSENHSLNEEMKKTFDQMDELIKEQLSNTEEDFYSDYEGSGKNWIDKLIAGDTSFYYGFNSTEAGIEPANNEKCEFLNFITIQYFRTVGMRKIITENIQNMLNIFDENKNALNENENVNYITENVNPEHILPHFIWIMQAKCSSGLLKADIQIVRNKTDLPFITSDQPVINMKATANGVEAPTEFVLWYPLSPEAGVIINGGQGEKILNERSDVDTLNKMIWEHSFEYVIGSNEDALKATFENISMQ